MKNKCILFLAVAFYSLSVWAGDYEVISPNNQLKIKLHIDNGTQYEIWALENQLISPSTIGLNLNNGTVIGKGTVKNVERNSVNNVIDVPIGKNKTLNEVYNELIIHFNENYDLVVRAYNEGIAYRFITALENDIIINNEDAIFNFAGNPTVFFPEADNFEHWEKRYTEIRVNDIKNNRFGITPILFSYDSTPYKIVITESDVYDYPGLYVQENGTGSMKGMWAKYPKTVEEPDNFYSNHQPITRYDYIANTTGTRTFPWRVFVISAEDKDLLNNELVYMLAEPCRLTDIDWVKPGKSTWEWWHKAMLDEDMVNFKVGNDNLSFNLFKYYVDFAATNNIEYLTLDAGSNGSYVPQLCAYAKSKGVKIIMWTWASCVVDPGRESWMADEKRRGISGFKVDFFNRNDQLAMRWAYQMAQQAADLGLVLNFHGCPVPTGLNRTFPNILNFEAILGNEENFWRNGCDPDYHVSFPFIRSLVGPSDFTPGSFRNKTKLLFEPVDQPNVVPSSQGTRAHEMAMYVVFDHWMAYLCDAPTEYQKFPDLLDILSTVPSVWDKTVPLSGEVGKYIVMAKQTGDDWYVGGMASWDAKSTTVNLDFLKPEILYKAVIVKDGMNANSYPVRYACDTIIVTNEDVLSFDMARGGGFMIRLKEELGNSSLTKVKNKSFVYFDKYNGMLNVRSEDAIQFISVYNYFGQCLYQKDCADRGSAFQINLSQLNRGAYIAKIQTESATDSVKFIY